MKLTNLVTSLLIVGGALLTSCIREDLSECRSTNKLLLSYKGDGTTEIFPDKICRVEMYVFDSADRCVSASTLPKDQVESRTAILPSLEAGQYRIVCIGNAHQTEIRGVESGDYSAMTFAAADYHAGNTVATNDSLYYATHDYTVGGFDEDRVETILFASSHYDLRVEVAGVPEPEVRAASLPVLKICGVTPCTDFENRVCGEATDYTMEVDSYDAAAELMTAKANIMRHKNHEDVNLTLTTADGTTELARVNFAEFLAAHPSIDCSKHEVLIPIRIEFRSGQVYVTVPEWFVEEVKPEF